MTFIMKNNLRKWKVRLPEKGSSLKKGLFLSVLFLGIGQSYAQKITLHTKKESLKKVMSQIEQQSGFTFFYKSTLLKSSNPVTVNLNEADVHTALEKVFAGQPLQYSIANKTIVIRGNGKSAYRQLKDREFMLTGVLLDSSDYPLDNVEILNTTNKDVAYSNTNGQFQIIANIGDVLLFKSDDINDTRFTIGDNAKATFRIKRNSKLLQMVSIQTSVDKKNPTNFIDVDLTNRNYMNLGQVLQGTIPGVSLQVTSSSTKTVTGVQVVTHGNTSGTNEVSQVRVLSVDQFLKEYSNGQAIIDALAKGDRPSWIPASVTGVLTSTSVTSTLVPQLRGINAFSTASSAMLVVIDGFIRDGFPADYPMSNVESVRVIKDPKELQKWGPKGSNGVILVTTKRNKHRYPTINYTANTYYLPAPKFDRSKMRLASSSQLLDYMKDAYDSSFLSLNGPNSFGQRPASRLLSQLQSGVISENQFSTSWDSLKGLDNQSQLNMMFQNVVNTNHTLSVMGGDEKYRYSFIGSYNISNQNNLRNYNHSYYLNSNNQFNLFDSKLHIDWYLNYIHTDARSGSSFNPTNNDIDPYQMLLNKDGGYEYDYSTLNADANATIMKNGYKNYGVNILEDARLNSSTSVNNRGMSRLNWRWNLLDGLQWQSSIFYNLNNTHNEDFYDKESSYARQLVDQYGATVGNTVDFYAPPGNIMNKNKTNQWDITVRSALSYSKQFGAHSITMSLGGGGYKYQSLRPASNTLYGYNTKTKKGSTVFLPMNNASVYNFYSLLSGGTSLFYPSNLLLNTSGGDSSYNKSLNWNGNVAYNFAKKVDFNFSINNAISPNYGQSPAYATTRSYTSNIGYHLFNRGPRYFINDVSLHGGVTGTVMPTLISSYSNSRYLQSYWNNYGIWITGATPSQQSGQKSKTTFQSLEARLWKDQLNVNVGFNQQKISGLSSVNDNVTTYDSSSSSKYFSFVVNGHFRENLLTFNFNYNKSPEGQSQVNAFGSYDIAKETYFHSKKISTLVADVTIESISPMQALGIMMNTNVPQSGNYSLATNGTYSLLPPKNTDVEAHTKIGFLADKYSVDLRYYNRKTSGLNNNVPILTDPSTGLSSVVTYSEISNKGVEFYLTGNLVKSKLFSYTLTLNGAYNVNVADKVPTSAFTMTSGYLSAYRNGYSVNNLWSYRWAGLDESGNPQIYDHSGKIVSEPDSATLQNSLVYSGTTRAPWNGGIIQEATFGPLVARVTMTFGLGGVMRYYMPAPSGNTIDYSSMVDKRWRHPGDEKKTDIPALAASGVNYASRAFITQYSSNSIQSSDYMRLQEIMVGWNAPSRLLKKLGFTSCSFIVQMQNVAIWTKNNWHIDPAIISSTGQIGMPINKVYSCSVNLGF